MAKYVCNMYNVELNHDISGDMIITNATLTNVVAEKNEEIFVIPNKCTAIGSSAFYSCPSVKQILIPNSVRIIEKHAFRGCCDLTDIYYNGTMYEWECIDFYADWSYDLNAPTVHCLDGDIKINFYEWELQNVILTHKNTGLEGCKEIRLDTNQTSYIIPAYVVAIQDQAISSGNLKSVEIPKSVKKIGSCAFAYCTQLKDIYYDGTKEEWSKIDFASYWDYKTPNYIIHCTDGDIEVTNDL